MKTVVLGVTGSVAAYRACDIVSQLKKLGVSVHVILTRAGAQFITPLALESLAHTPVVTDMFNRENPWEVEHISLAKKADVFLVAPASANFIGKAAHGIADDMLTTTLLATQAPVCVAPAMNTNMYLNPVVQENMETLKARGYTFIQPDEGMLACGDVGIGHIAQVEEIVRQVYTLLYPKQDFEGVRLVVSAGPTREAIDPVRYLSNRSSGKMGYAIAEAAVQRGAQVTLVSGPVAVEPPAGLDKLVNVLSVEQMYSAIDAHFGAADALVMAAAPADFAPVAVSDQKIKKQGEGLELSLSPTRDILASMGKRKTNQVLVGFSAETENLAQNALGKLAAKNLDMIAANDVSGTETGFESDDNAVTLYSAEGTVLESGRMRKRDLAHWLLDRLCERLSARELADKK